jgi:hypothetical protein
MITILENDKNEQIFTSLNNGDIKTQFTTTSNYIEFIRDGEYIDFELSNNILSVPGVISTNGINIVMFQKRSIIIKKTFEKEKTREDFIIVCQNPEEIMGLKDKKKENIFIIKENKNYYPIVMVLKSNEITKTMDVIKSFKYDDKPDNIVAHISDFYDKNCTGTFMDTVVYRNSSLTSRLMKYYLEQLRDKNYAVKSQFIDVRNKCKYLITHNNTIIPVRPSGSLFDIPIVKNIDKYIQSFSTTIENLNNLYKNSNKNISTKPIGVYYDDITNTHIKIIAIMTKTHDIIPVQEINMTIKKIEDMNLIYENKPLTDKIDAEIAKGKTNFQIDNRIMSVNIDKYENESFELFRLEFSDYINRPANAALKTKIDEIINNNNLYKKDKSDKIKLLIYKLIDRNLYDKYSNILKKTNNPNIDLPDEIDVDYSSEQSGGKYDKLMHTITKLPDLTKYQINNDRTVCKIHKDKNKCNLNPHCRWTHTGCYMAATQDMIITFVNKIAEQLARNDLKAFEIMRVGNYFVSDVVDYNKFTEREGQRIIRSTSNNIKKVLSEIFGEDYIPSKIGRRKSGKILEINYQQLNIDNPMIDFKDMFIQNIIENNLTIFRAYVNGYYWIKNKYNDIDNRNLGYYNPLQTDLSNYFRSLVIDWLNDSKNKKIIDTHLLQYMDVKKNVKNEIQEFILKLAKEIIILTNCIVELFVLSKINQIPIVVYNEDNKVIYIFDKGITYNSNIDKKIPDNSQKFIKDDRKNVVNLRFTFISSNKIPDEIATIYFKDK